MIRAFIFDLDGVVVDTARYHYAAWKELAADLGFHFTEEENEKLKGVSRMRSLDILLEAGGLRFPKVEKLKMAERKNARYVELISGMTPDEVLPGVLNFLVTTRNLNIRTALGSASRNAPLILDKTGLASWFDVVVDGNSVSEAKPDPEVFLKAASLLGVYPGDSIVFEDAVAGIEAADNAGMRSVGVGDAVVLKKAGYVIPGFSGLTASLILDILNK